MIVKHVHSTRHLCLFHSKQQQMVKNWSTIKGNNEWIRDPQHHYNHYFFCWLYIDFYIDKRVLSEESFYIPDLWRQLQQPIQLTNKTSSRKIWNLDDCNLPVKTIMSSEKLFILRRDVINCYHVDRQQLWLEKNRHNC